MLTLSTIAVIVTVASLLQLLRCLVCLDGRFRNAGIFRHLSTIQVCSLLTGCLIWSVEAGMRRNRWMILSGEDAWTLGQMLAVMVALHTICTSLLEFAAAFKETSSEHSEGVYFIFARYLAVPK